LRNTLAIITSLLARPTNRWATCLGYRVIEPRRGCGRRSRAVRYTTSSAS